MPEILTVEVSTIYALSMPTHINIRLDGVPTVVVIEGDTIETKDGELIVKKGETVVGHFAKPSVQGWWFTVSARRKGAGVNSPIRGACGGGGFQEPSPTRQLYPKPNA